MATRIIKTCQNCGKLFESNQLNIRRKQNAKFCSVSCRGIASRGSKNKCKVSDCDRKFQAKGLCNTHYERQRRTGEYKTIKVNNGVGKTPEERFWSRVDKSHGPDSCWIWQGNANPYGMVSVNGKSVGSHRAAWFYAKGSFPILDLLHSCDTPRCVNPRHLREGTNAENIKDKIARHRQLRGEKIALAKLTKHDVLEIRNSKDSEKELMEKYQVSRSAISNVRRNISWRHVK